MFVGLNSSIKLVCEMLLLGTHGVLISETCVKFLDQYTTHGQCDYKPAVTFPVAQHCRLLTGTARVLRRIMCEQLAQRQYVGNSNLQGASA